MASTRQITGYDLNGELENQTYVSLKKNHRSDVGKDSK